MRRPEKWQLPESNVFVTTKHLRHALQGAVHHYLPSQHQLACPKCGGELYDNRCENLERERKRARGCDNNNMPSFKCRGMQCGWLQWIETPVPLLPKHASECMEVLADVYENWSAAESLERFDCDPGYHSEITMRAFGGTINDSSMTVRRRDPPHSQPMCLGWVCGGNTTICSSSMTYEKRWTPSKHRICKNEAAPLTNAFFSVQRQEGIFSSLEPSEQHKWPADRAFNCAEDPINLRPCANSWLTTGWRPSVLPHADPSAHRTIVAPLAQSVTIPRHITLKLPSVMDELGDNGKPKGGGATYVRNRLLTPSYRLDMTSSRAQSDDYFFPQMKGPGPSLIKLK